MMELHEDTFLYFTNIHWQSKASFYEHILELVKYRLMLNKSKTALCVVLYLKWINIYKQTINKYMDILDLMLIKKNID